MSTTIKEQFMAAASAGDVAQLRELCPFRKHDISAADVQDVLATAINTTQTAVVEYLFTEFPEMQANDYAIRAAARAGSIPIFSQLLARDPSVATKQFERYSSVLAIACTARAPIDFLQFLLEQGANPNEDPDVSPYPLALVAALYPDGDSAPIDLLLKHGARLAGSGALGSAAYFGKEESLRYLLERGGKPDTDARKIGSWTSGDHPLHSSLSGGYLGTARLLLDHCSSIEVVDRNRKSIAEMTAYLEARGHDRTEFTTLLSQVAERRLASK